MTVRVNLDHELQSFVEQQVSRSCHQTVAAYLESLVRDAMIRSNGEIPADRNDSDQSEAPWQIALDVGSQVPDRAWEQVPQDLARNLDHYLYGSPREG